MGLDPAPFFMSPKFSIPMSLQEMFASWLAQFLGYALGRIAAIFVMGLITWLLWWLPYRIQEQATEYEIPQLNAAKHQRYS